MTTDFMEPDYEGIDSRIDELRSEGKDNEARDLVQKALETAPDDSELLIRLGGIYFEMNNIPQASKVLRRARELGDSDAEIDYLLGECAIYSKDFSQAKEHYDNYLVNLIGPGEVCPIDVIDEERIYGIGREFYEQQEYIQALKVFRFLFTHGSLLKSVGYFSAAECLHKFGERFQKEKYSYMKQASKFVGIVAHCCRRKYAGFLYDDINKEKDPAKKQEMADKAISLFEEEGIENIHNIERLTKLKALYRRHRDWDEKTEGKIIQCTRKIKKIKEDHENIVRYSKGGKASFKKVNKKDSN